MVSKTVVSKQVSTETKVSQVVEDNTIAIADVRLAVEEHHNGCAEPCRLQPDRGRLACRSDEPATASGDHTHGTGEKVSYAAIIKHFTAQSILRDLSAKSKVKSDSMVTAKVTQKTKLPSAGCHSGCQHSALFGRCALGRQHLL